MQSLKLALIQNETHWHDPSSNRQMFSEILNRIATPCDLILMPEMFSTGFTMASQEVAETMQGATVAWMQQQAQRLGSVLAGSVVIEEGGRYFNRFIAAYPDGHLFTYDKRHLFRMASEHEYYQAGTDRSVFQVAGWRVCPMVCYDLRFPVWLRNRDDYDVLVCVANWPAARRAAWNTLLRARGIENQCYIAAVNIVGRDGNHINYSGGSAVYGPEGEIYCELFDKAGLGCVELDATKLLNLRRDFPVWQDADDFGLKLE